MDDLMELRGRFRGVPQHMALFIFSLLVVIPVTVSSNIQAVNMITSPPFNNTKRYSWFKGFGENETLPGTYSLCPNVSDPNGLSVAQGVERYIDRRNLWGIKNIQFYLQSPFLLPLFQSFLGLKEFMGPYLVSLQINNLKIAELQDALTYAWLPSLEKSNWTATRTEIIQTFNGTGYFSQNGMPLMVIVYTLPVPDIFSNFSRNLPRYPWLYARNSTLHELTRIDPPVIGDFIQRLQQKGLPVYEGPVFSKTNVLENLYLRANFTSGYFDTDQLKADVMGFTQQLRVKEGCGDANMSDVDVHFGLLKPHVMAVRRNRAFSDLKLMPMPFVITVQQKKYVQYAADLAVGLANHSDRYYKQDMSNATETKIPGFGLVELPPVDPAFSFRMYLNRPLNVQYLPLLEVLMMSHLNTDRDPDGRVEVRLWDFDPNGWIVKFFVVLRHTKVPVPYASFVVDARLLYAANIYRKLDGFELRLSNASTAYKLMKDSYPAYWLDTIKASTLAQCEGESIWSLPVEEQLCPLKKTFTLYVERYSNLGLEDLISNTKWLPNSDKVLDAVQQAFAVANPVTVDRLTLTIALMERNDTLMTTAGRDAFKFTFALSYPKNGGRNLLETVALSIT